MSPVNRPLLLALALALLSGCQAVDRCAPHTGVAHVVLFWLKPDAPAAEREAIEQDALTLIKIPGILSVRSGRPNLGRDAHVDSSYDVGLVMLFESPEARAAYDDHPLHKELVAKHTPYIAKMQVYDIKF